MGQTTKPRRTACSLVAASVLFAAVPAILAGDDPSAETPADPAVIRGMVRDVEDLPVADAGIRVLRQDLSMESRDWHPRHWIPGVETRTGVDGRFQVQLPDGQAFKLRVTADGHPPLTLEEIPPGAAVNARLVPGHALTGTVVDLDGKALSGARVTACDRSALEFGRDSCATVETDTEGAFAFAQLPAGPTQLRAVAPGRAVSNVENVKLPPGPDVRPPVLVLRPGASVRGRVVDENDRAVSGARIWAGATTRAAGTLRGGSKWPDFTGDDGRFTLEGLPAEARYVVAAHRSDRAVARTDALTVEAGRNIEGIELAMPSPAVIKMRLIGEEEQPVDHIDLSVIPARGGGARERLDSRWIARDGDGRFTVRMPRVGTLDLLIEPDGFTDVERNGVDLAAGRTIDLGTIKVGRGMPIAGRVVDRDAQPISGATVRASWTAHERSRSRVVQSGDDGRFRIDGLGQTAVELEVEAIGFVTEMRDEVDPGELELEFRLDPTGRITGRVELEDGSGPPAFRVVVHREAQDDRSTGGDFPHEQRFPSGDGAYDVDNLSPGRYTVEARAADHAPGRATGVELESGGTATAETIVLEPGMVLRGKVLAADDDAPLLGARVEAMGSSGPVAELFRGTEGSSMTDAEGRFALDSLGPGAYRLHTEHAGFAPELTAAVLDPEWASDEVLIRLYRGGHVQGTVRDEQGQPMAEEKLVATKSLIQLEAAQYARTDGEGFYEIPRLSPGSYRVMRIRGNSMQTKTAVIREGEVTIVDFGESPRIRLRGTVLRHGQPLPGATLFFSEGGRSLTFETLKFAEADGAGLFEIGLDRPGAYRVIVGEAGAGMGASSVELLVPDEPEVRRDILLGGDGISGTILDPDGNPIIAANVSARREGTSFDDLSGMQIAETDPGGRYEINGLSPGLYRITVAAEGYRIGTLYPIEVVEGEAVGGVDLRLERGHTLQGTVIDAQGRGIHGAYVFAAPSGSFGAVDAMTAETDVNGAFRMTDPASGPIDLTAISSGWAPARLVGFVAPGAADAPGPVLQASAGGSLRVLVVGLDGLPRPGVTLVVRATPGFLASDVANLFQPPPPTDAAGRSRVTRLAPGTYEVGVPARGDVPAVVVVVSEGAETPVRVELP